VPLEPVNPAIQKSIPQAHRSMLKRVSYEPELGVVEPTPVPPVETWETQEIVAHYRKGTGLKNLFFRIRWSGFDASSDSLKRASEVTGDLRQVYLEKMGVSAPEMLVGNTIGDDLDKLPLD